MDEYTFADTDFAVEIEMDEIFNEDFEDDFPISYEYEDYDNEEYIDYYAEASLFGWEN